MSPEVTVFANLTVLSNKEYLDRQVRRSQWRPIFVWKPEYHNSSLLTHFKSKFVFNTLKCVTISRNCFTFVVCSWSNSRKDPKRVFLSLRPLTSLLRIFREPQSLFVIYNIYAPNPTFANCHKQESLVPSRRGALHRKIIVALSFGQNWPTRSANQQVNHISSTELRAVSGQTDPAWP